MKRHPWGLKLWLFSFSASIIAATACGARSSLEEGKSRPRPIELEAGTGGGPIELEAGSEGGPIEAGPDVEDAGPDVEDAHPDVEPFNCEEAGITFIYLVTQESDLFRFYPPDLSFAPIGTIQCPSQAGATPYSMAVDRKGTGYVVFNDGELFKVSTANASCKKTGFLPGQEGFTPTFGMGFSANKNDPGETLFVAGTTPGEQLATIDIATMDLNIVGTFGSPVGNLELTGTGDGRLFGFGHDPGITGFHLAEIDKTNASILSDLIVPVGQPNSAWAFAFFGGDFYFFTSVGSGSSVVTRYHPDDGSFTPVATLNRTIVGAGVSTCAPE